MLGSCSALDHYETTVRPLRAPGARAAPEWLRRPPTQEVPGCRLRTALRVALVGRFSSDHRGRALNGAQVRQNAHRHRAGLRVWLCGRKNRFCFKAGRRPFLSLPHSAVIHSLPRSALRKTWPSTVLTPFHNGTSQAKQASLSQSPAPPPRPALPTKQRSINQLPSTHPTIQSV